MAFTVLQMNLVAPEPWQFAIGVTVLIGAVYATWRRFRPSLRLWMDARDVIAGRDPVMDKSGNVAKPGQPGLAHWMGDVVNQLARLTDVIADQKKSDARIGTLETRVDGHETAIALLGGGQFERGADKALRAVELKQQDVIDVPNEEKP